MQQARLPEVLLHGGSLAPVHLQPVPDDLLGVIGPDLQVRCALRGRGEGRHHNLRLAVSSRQVDVGNIVALATVATQAATQALLHQHLLPQAHVECHLHLGQLQELDSLNPGPGEAIQDEALLPCLSTLLHAMTQQLEYQVVWHKLALVDYVRQLLPKRAASLHFSSDQVPCGDVSHVEMLSCPRSIRPLPYARRSQEHPFDAVGEVSRGSSVLPLGH
mmetsp:Transcript_31165/g.69297  ORF Transcript_31165/g.69297 Transcript_31165/m.69297 type:complete len:218 (-) Transcript_31165:145-798(-)